MLNAKRLIFILIVLIGFAFQGFSQKRVKYKDLFPILQSKDYQTAEPLLLRYLADNQDEANPHFYLGEILTAKLDSTEIFPNSKPFDSLANLAITSYKKAISLVNDKEIRKNDDYYIAFNRRDLRTGKFGIKISDVHLDYENKISALSEKLALIDQVYIQKSTTDSIISGLNSKVAALQEQFPNEKAFLLRSNPDDFNKVRSINKIYAQLKLEIDNYFELLDRLKSANKSPEMKIEAIDNWMAIQPQTINLFDSVIILNDYQSYLSLVLLKIEDEIIPLKALLTETDKALNEVIEENQDISDSSQIREVEIPAKLAEQLTELNAGALPLKVLEYKTLKNEAQLLQNTSLFPVLNDSTNVFQMVSILKRHKNHFSNMDQLLALIDEFANEENTLNYKFYLENFTPSFEGYLKTEKTLTAQKLSLIEDECAQLEVLSKLFIYKKDSIYSDSIFAKNMDSTSYVIEFFENDNDLLIGGQKGINPFIGKAKFDMNVEHLQILQDSAQFLSIIDLKDKILVNTALNKQSNQFKISGFSPKIEPLWSLQFESDLPVVSAREEAGILFLYDKEGEVIKTLDSKGKAIGN